ncbi:MAG: hypothetical protein IJU27_04975 [Bacteroidales bacterium]|nr:hypothetical protein [Bacteroidales bacterium]
MGLLFKKNIRDNFSRSELTMSRFIVAGCLLLVVLNVALFIFVPKNLAPLSIIASNAITAIIAVLAMKPVDTLIQNALVKRQDELRDGAARQKALEERIDELEHENKALENRLDTRSQTGAAPAEVNYTFKLEQMEYSKKGYVVKEDELESFLEDSRFRDKIPDIGLLDKMLGAMKLKENGVRKILYLHKNYYKVSIGIDFSRIKFAYDGDKTLFYGVRFAMLHDISSELDRDPGDIDHCWILNVGEEHSEILSDPGYDAFKEGYSLMQDELTRQSLEREVQDLCTEYTRIFRESLKERFPGIDFTDEIETSDKSWYSLRDGRSNIREIASSMLMLANVINRTQSVDDQNQQI